MILFHDLYFLVLLILPCFGLLGATFSQNSSNAKEDEGWLLFFTFYSLSVKITNYTSADLKKHVLDKRFTPETLNTTASHFNSRSHKRMRGTARDKSVSNEVLH